MTLSRNDTKAAQIEPLPRPLPAIPFRLARPLTAGKSHENDTETRRKNKLSGQLCRRVSVPLIKNRKLTAEKTPRNDTRIGHFRGVGLSLSAIPLCFPKAFTEGKSRENDTETIHKNRLSRNTGQQAEKGTAMPRMSKKRKREWAFFLNDRNRITYNDLCRKCRRPCKQSFRALVIDCPLYYSKRAKERP